MTEKVRLYQWKQQCLFWFVLLLLHLGAVAGKGNFTATANVSLSTSLFPTHTPNRTATIPAVADVYLKKNVTASLSRTRNVTIIAPAGAARTQTATHSKNETGTVRVMEPRLSNTSRLSQSFTLAIAENRTNQSSTNHLSSSATVAVPEIFHANRSNTLVSHTLQLHTPSAGTKTRTLPRARSQTVVLPGPVLSVTQHLFSTTIAVHGPSPTVTKGLIPALSATLPVPRTATRSQTPPRVPPPRTPSQSLSLIPVVPVRTPTLPSTISNQLTATPPLGPIVHASSTGTASTSLSAVPGVSRTLPKIPTLPPSITRPMIQTVSVSKTSELTASETLTEILTFTLSKELTPPPTKTKSVPPTATETYTITPPPTPTHTRTFDETITVSVTPPPTETVTTTQLVTITLTPPPPPTATRTRTKTESTTLVETVSVADSPTRTVVFTNTVSSTASLEQTDSVTRGQLRVVRPRFPIMWEDAIQTGSPIEDRQVTVRISGGSFNLMGQSYNRLFFFEHVNVSGDHAPVAGLRLWALWWHESIEVSMFDMTFTLLHDSALKLPEEETLVVHLDNYVTAQKVALNPPYVLITIKPGINPETAARNAARLLPNRTIDYDYRGDPVVSGLGAAIASIGGAAVYSMQGYRASIPILMSRCYEQNSAGKILSFVESPLPLAIGDSKFRWNFGAVVLNTSVVLFLLFVHFVFAVARGSQRRGATFLSMLASGGFPSRSSYLLAIMPSCVHCTVNILVNAWDLTAELVTFFMLIPWICAATVIAGITTLGFRAEYVRFKSQKELDEALRDKMEEKNFFNQNRSPVTLPPGRQKSANIERPFLRIFLNACFWRNDERLAARYPFFCQRYRFFFNQCRFRYRWFLVEELALGALIAGLLGASKGKEMWCYGCSVGVVLLLAAHLLILIVLRPYRRPFSNIIMIALTILEGLGAAIGVASMGESFKEFSSATANRLFDAASGFSIFTSVLLILAAMVECASSFFEYQHQQTTFAALMSAEQARLARREARFVRRHQKRLARENCLYDKDEDDQFLYGDEQRGMHVEDNEDESDESDESGSEMDIFEVQRPLLSRFDLVLLLGEAEAEELIQRQLAAPDASAERRNRRNNKGRRRREGSSKSNGDDESPFVEGIEMASVPILQHQPPPPSSLPPQLRPPAMFSSDEEEFSPTATEAVAARVVPVHEPSSKRVVLMSSDSGDDSAEELARKILQLKEEKKMLEQQLKRSASRSVNVDTTTTTSDSEDVGKAEKKRKKMEKKMMKKMWKQQHQQQQQQQYSTINVDSSASDDDDDEHYSSKKKEKKGKKKGKNKTKSQRSFYWERAGSEQEGDTQYFVDPRVASGEALDPRIEQEKKEREEEERRRKKEEEEENEAEREPYKKANFKELMLSFVPKDDVGEAVRRPKKKDPTELQQMELREWDPDGVDVAFDESHSDLPLQQKQPLVQRQHLEAMMDRDL